MNTAFILPMKMYYQNKKQSFTALATVLLLFSGTFTSCNTHQKAAKLIGNSVREQMGKFVQNEEVTIENKINHLEHLIPNPTVSDIFSEKTELIDTH